MYIPAPLKEYGKNEFAQTVYSCTWRTLKNRLTARGHVLSDLGIEETDQYLQIESVKEIFSILGRPEVKAK